jgi:hypothetical protein
MIRKTKVPVKSLPAVVEWILRNATGQELDYMDSLARSTDFPILVKLIGKFKDFNVYEVFNYKMNNDHDLALFRAAKVGEVVAFDSFIMACQAAKIEVKRRREQS